MKERNKQQQHFSLLQPIYRRYLKVSVIHRRKAAGGKERINRRRRIKEKRQEQNRTATTTITSKTGHQNRETNNNRIALHISIADGKRPSMPTLMGTQNHKQFSHTRESDRVDVRFCVCVISGVYNLLFGNRFVVSAQQS